MCVGSRQTWCVGGLSLAVAMVWGETARPASVVCIGSGQRWCMGCSSLAAVMAVGRKSAVHATMSTRASLAVVFDASVPGLY